MRGRPDPCTPHALRRGMLSVGPRGSGKEQARILLPTLRQTRAGSRSRGPKSLSPFAADRENRAGARRGCEAGIVRGCWASRGGLTDDRSYTTGPGPAFARCGRTTIANRRRPELQRPRRSVRLWIMPSHMQPGTQPVPPQQKKYAPRATPTPAGPPDSCNLHSRVAPIPVACVHWRRPAWL